MDASKIAIQIASEFTGSKAFKQAETATAKLQRSVKNLGRTLGVTLSLAAIVNFGKASVRAFADAEREGLVLANTMKNLGLAFDTSRVSAYIENIGRLYGITGDQAVPAMQALLSATGSVTKSQQLMNTAMNIAVANNISLSEAAKGLSQAYLGNRKALNQYNTGLTKAELQLKSFEDLQSLLDSRLKGVAADAAETYSGKLLILAENANQAKEAIGKGLVDSFILLAGDNSLEVATSKMKDFGDQIAYAVLGAADLLKKILDIGKETNNVIVGPDGITRTRRPSALQELAGYGKKVAAQNAPMGVPGAISGKSLVGAAYFAAQKKADDAAIKRQKELQAIERKRLDNLRKIAAEAAKKAALDKLSAFLNKANQLFDMDRIQLAAAAMSKQTEEDKIRIRLKQEILDLEDAINEGNVEAAARLASSIATDSQLLGQLRGDMIKLGDVPDPFAQWLQTLLAIAAQLALLSQIPVTTTMLGGVVPGTTPGQTGIPGMGGVASPGFGMGGWTQAIPKSFAPGDIPGLSGSRGFSLASVTVNVQGSVTTQQDLVSAITEGIYNNQASGIPINYSTVY